MKVMHSLPYKAWNHLNWRFCWKCKAIRPPRAHHCSKCETCHLRMDHHCYWVGNCVSIQNHKVFLIFASHSAIAAILQVATMAYQYSIWDMEKFDWSSHHGISTIICIILTFLIGGLCYEQ